MITLDVSAGARGLAALVGRAVALDQMAVARFQLLGEGLVDVFVTTPFDCIAARRIEGAVSRDGAVVTARQLLDALRDAPRGEWREIGPAVDASWPGALPPAGGFAERDTVPVAVAHQLANEGRSLARQFSGPAGPPKSLMNAVVLTVASESDQPVEIPMRMVFACTALGLIPNAAASIEVPRHLRIATAGRWIRLDAPFGSVYYNQGFDLLG